MGNTFNTLCVVAALLGPDDRRRREYCNDLMKMMIVGLIILAVAQFIYFRNNVKPVEICKDPLVDMVSVENMKLHRGPIAEKVEPEEFWRNLPPIDNEFQEKISTLLEMENRQLFKDLLQAVQSCVAGKKSFEDFKMETDKLIDMDDKKSKT